MNISKKKVFVVTLVICLVAIISMGTLAWFNDTELVTNKFMVADSDDGDNTPDFSVDLYEHYVDPDTGAVDPSDKVEENTYNSIAPGDVLSKNPTVMNDGMYSQYVRTVVTLTDASTWIRANQKYGFTSESVNILEKLIDLNAKWVRYDAPVYDESADTLTYVYYYNDVLVSGATAASVFTEVTIPSELQSEDMDFYGDKSFNINVKADAIQSENILRDATIENNEAYTAFNVANWTAGTAYGS